MESRRRDERRSECADAIAWIALALAVFLLATLYVSDFVIDDAYISARYARNLANGYGLAYNPGNAPGEGYSNLIFVLLLALISKLGAETIAAAKVLSVIFGLATVVMSALVARSIIPKHANVVPLLVSASFPLILWAAGGLATTLISFCMAIWLWASISLMKGIRPRRAQLWLAICSGMAPLIRPEAVLLLPIYVLLLMYWQRTTGQRANWILPATIGISLGFLELWRLKYFGLPLPLPFYVKVDPGSAMQKLTGVVYLHRFIWQYGGGAIGYLAIAYAIMRALSREVEDRILWLPIVAALPWIVFVLAVGKDWMPQYRFLVPLVVPLQVLTAMALGRIADCFDPIRGMPRIVFAAGIAVVLLGCFVGGLGAVMASDWYTPKMESIRFHTAAVAQQRRQGEYLRIAGGSKLTVAALDVGAIGYISDAKIIDIWGLTSPENAGRSPEDIAAYVLSQKPDYVQVYDHPLEADPAFVAQYVRVEGVPWFLWKRIDLEVSEISNL